MIKKKLFTYKSGDEYSIMVGSVGGWTTTNFGIAVIVAVVVIIVAVVVVSVVVVIVVSVIVIVVGVVIVVSVIVSPG